MSKISIKNLNILIIIKKILINRFLMQHFLIYVIIDIRIIEYNSHFHHNDWTFAIWV